MYCPESELKMTELGLLYKQLIVQPAPTQPAYYMMVKQLIKEAKEEFPDMDADVYWNGPRAVETGYYDDDQFHEDLSLWFMKWFGDRETEGGNDIE